MALYRFIHAMKRMRSSEEEERNMALTLGIGSCREDGSGSSKGKVMTGEKKGDSESSGLYTNWLTLKIGPCIEDRSSKHIYGMDEANRGESSSSRSILEINSCKEHGSNKEVKIREDSIFLRQIEEDILNIIFCKFPLPTLLQAQAVCTSWQTFISSSVHFHNVWEQSNMQMWLVVGLHDNTGKGSKGLAFYDVSGRVLYKKIFSDEWRGEKSKWCFRAGDGGLFVFNNLTNGLLKVINPLTMQSHYLEDAMVTITNIEDAMLTNKLSHYMQRYHDHAFVHLKVDPEGKTYQVFVIIAHIYLLEGKNLGVFIYKSAEQRWFIRGIDTGMTMNFFPEFIIQNQKIYLFSYDGQKAGMYNLKGNGKFHYIAGMKPVMCNRTLGIVLCKSRIIMVCRSEPMERPPYTHTLILYEFDRLRMQWRSLYEDIISTQIEYDDVTCVGGDYIWVAEEDGPGFLNSVIRIEIDTGEVIKWAADVKDYYMGYCASTRLSFCPCS